MYTAPWKSLNILLKWYYTISFIIFFDEVQGLFGLGTDQQNVVIIPRFICIKKDFML